MNCRADWARHRVRELTVDAPLQTPCKHRAPTNRYHRTLYSDLARNPTKPDLAIIDKGMASRFFRASLCPS